mmetsp:Transcript_8699/g.17059  ORF Transcript_8699/g.17059 Transcript_8699/m.17059 type:complete len:272 (-) Transcript_8699:223-1038(-)
MLTAHEPLYWGWRSFLVLNCSEAALLELMGLYLTYTVLRANYRVISLNKKMPKWIEYSYVVAAILIGILQLAGVILVLLTDKLSCLVFAPAAAIIAVMFFGTIFEYSLYNLYREIGKSNKNIASTQSTGNGKPCGNTGSTHTAFEMKSSGAQEATKLTGDDSSLASSPAARIRKLTLTRMHSAAASLHKVEIKVMLTMILCIHLCIIIVVFMAMAILRQLTTTKSFSSGVDEEAENYLLTKDLAHWGRIIFVAGFYQVYAYQQLPAWATCF